MKTPSHPPTLITLAKRALRDEIALAAGSRILVATSGGPDSMALLDVLAALSKAHTPVRFGIAAHGVDHGLRQAASAELDLAEAHADLLGVPFSRSRLKVGTGSNLQARAREARHAALEKARNRTKSMFIATAHHANDRAETVLMRILRGAGASGLAVLPPLDGHLIRPLIRATHKDILLHLERHAIPFARDPSNDDPHYLRTRVRQDVLPLVESLDPAITAHLCALADDMARFREAGAPLYPIPRATRIALARLASQSGTIAAKAADQVTVLLPGGLEARRKERRNPKKR